ncbi:hypothetical protein BX661DRAFT_175226 [Kickxella alabastrina]|uniref:uncharacterized protein n=1 Tax=Kickxella alabastrina TaxID=61397 RepID=UPI0022206D20|nr:uncharacterized protein BX661DRAFT_175226 [Kickxella alabastrina]KAI7834629.1 hypothetical protein BX661DRAFT_175226 [Kickxella alabastrina]
MPFKITQSTRRCYKKIGLAQVSHYSGQWRCSVCDVQFGSEGDVRAHFASEHLFAPLDDFN